MIKTQLYGCRSLALFKVNNLNASYDDCKYVIQHDPNNVEVLLRKAAIEMLRKQFYLAVDTYKRVRELEIANKEAVSGQLKAVHMMLDI